MRLKLKQVNYVILTIFSICIILTAGFITGCGDEGDPVTDMVSGEGDKTTDPDPDPVDPVVDPPPDPVDPPPAPGVSYKDDINPILAQRCAVRGCHHNAAQGGLNVLTYDNFKKGGQSGASFIPNDGDNSLVVKYLTGEKQPQMPLGGGPPLNADEIQLFIDWIDEGGVNN